MGRISIVEGAANLLAATATSYVGWLCYRRESPLWTVFSGAGFRSDEEDGAPDERAIARGWWGCLSAVTLAAGVSRQNNAEGPRPGPSGTQRGVTFGEAQVRYIPPRGACGAGRDADDVRADELEAALVRMVCDDTREEAEPAADCGNAAAQVPDNGGDNVEPAAVQDGRMLAPRAEFDLLRQLCVDLADLRHDRVVTEAQYKVVGDAATRLLNSIAERLPLEDENEGGPPVQRRDVGTEVEAPAQVVAGGNEAPPGMGDGQQARVEAAVQRVGGEARPADAVNRVELLRRVLAGDIGSVCGDDPEPEPTRVPACRGQLPADLDDTVREVVTAEEAEGARLERQLERRAHDGVRQADMVFVDDQPERDQPWAPVVEGLLDQVNVADELAEERANLLGWDQIPVRPGLNQGETNQPDLEEMLPEHRRLWQDVQAGCNYRVDVNHPHGRPVYGHARHITEQLVPAALVQEYDTTYDIQVQHLAARNRLVTISKYLPRYLEASSYCHQNDSLDKATARATLLVLELKEYHVRYTERTGKWFAPRHRHTFLVDTNLLPILRLNSLYQKHDNKLRLMLKNVATRHYAQYDCRNYTSERLLRVLVDTVDYCYAVDDVVIKNSRLLASSEMYSRLKLINSIYE